MSAPFTKQSMETLIRPIPQGPDRELDPRYHVQLTNQFEWKFRKPVVVAVIKSVEVIKRVTVTVDRYVVIVSIEAVDFRPWIKTSCGISAGRVPPV